MEPLDKIELIVKGTITQKKKEWERGKDSNLYTLDLDNQIDSKPGLD